MFILFSSFCGIPSRSLVLLPLRCFGVGPVRNHLPPSASLSIPFISSHWFPPFPYSSQPPSLFLFDCTFSFASVSPTFIIPIDFTRQWKFLPESHGGFTSYVHRAISLLQSGYCPLDYYDSALISRFSHSRLYFSDLFALSSLRSLRFRSHLLTVSRLFLHSRCLNYWVRSACYTVIASVDNSLPQSLLYRSLSFVSRICRC